MAFPLISSKILRYTYGLFNSLIAYLSVYLQYDLVTWDLRLILVIKLQIEESTLNNVQLSGELGLLCKLPPAKLVSLAT